MRKKFLTEGQNNFGNKIPYFITFYFDDFFSRKSYAEKFLIVTKYREGHKCDYQWTVMAIIKWDGIKADIGKPPKKPKCFQINLKISSKHVTL